MLNKIPSIEILIIGIIAIVALITLKIDGREIGIAAIAAIGGVMVSK